MTNSKNWLYLVLAFTIILIGMTHLVNASSGLKVFAYVHNAGSAVGRESSVTVNSDSDYDETKTVIVPQAYFYVELEYPPGYVDVGERLAGCVYISEDLQGYGYGYNNEQKRPERIDIYLSGSGSASSSSPSSNADSSSSSSSSSTSSKICILVRC
jgi:hypothetical protein